MDVTRGHYVKWNKPERQITYVLSLMHSRKSQPKHRVVIRSSEGAWVREGKAQCNQYTLYACVETSHRDQLLWTICTC
jgi:hypothetical protein